MKNEKQIYCLDLMNAFHIYNSFTFYLFPALDVWEELFLVCIWNLWAWPSFLTSSLQKGLENRNGYKVDFSSVCILLNTRDSS